MRLKNLQVQTDNNGLVWWVFEVEGVVDDATVQLFKYVPERALDERKRPVGTSPGARGAKDDEEALGLILDELWAQYKRPGKRPPEQREFDLPNRGQHGH